MNAPFTELPHGQPAVAPDRDPAGPPLRILVAEDNDEIRQLNTDALIRAGYEVDAAGDGADAWDTLQLIRYDLLVTDNFMPKLSGLELLKNLRSACMRMPVVMASGNLPQEEFARHPWLQPDATLIKPYTTVELVETVNRVLNTSRPDREWVAPPSNWQVQPAKAGWKW